MPSRNKTLFLYNGSTRQRYQSWQVYSEGVINRYFDVDSYLRTTFTLTLSGDCTIQFGVEDTVYLRATYTFANDSWTSQTDTPNEISFTASQSAISVSSTFTSGFTPPAAPSSLYQGSWIPGTSNYEYGYNSIPNVPITGAPADADFSRFSMLYDGNAYRLYVFRGGTSNTLYQFSWDGSSYAYGNNSIPVLTLTNAPGDADASSISMLHEGSTYHAYLRRLGDPATLYQFIWIPGTSTYQYGSPGYYPSLPVTGFPADTDWSRWTMLHDASTYRIYAFRNGENDLIRQGSWNAAASAYQYAFDSIPELNLVDFPANSNFGRAAMLYDGAYRFYFQSM